MGFNKIPLALKFNDSTGNAEGLIEFTLNVSDIGDICEDDYNPSLGDVLTYNSDLGCWTASAAPAVAAGALSSLTDVCDTDPVQYQSLVWNGSQWCPSSLVFTTPGGGGGGGTISSVNSVEPVDGDVPLDLSDPDPVNGTFFEPDPPGVGGTAGTLKIPTGGLGIGMGSNEPAAGGFVLGAAPPQGSTFVVGPATAGLTTIAGGTGTLSTGTGSNPTTINGGTGTVTVGDGTNETEINGSTGTLTTGATGTQTSINGSTGVVTAGTGTTQTTITPSTGQIQVGTTASTQTTIDPGTGVTLGTGEQIITLDPDDNNVGKVTIGSSSATQLYSTGKIAFPVNTVDSSLTQAGEVGWDSDSETLAVKLNGIVAHVAEDSFIRVRNETATQIGSLSAVYVSGAQGENPAISLADYTLSQNDQRLLAITMETLTAEAASTGFTITKGLLKNVDTSMFSVNDILYVGTLGTLRNTPPPHPNTIIRVGKVLKANADGIVLVEVQHGLAANDIDDVTADSNSLIFTTSTSSVSSLSGVSGSMVYFSGTDPAPYLTNIEDILSHEGYTIQEGETYLTGVAPADLNLAAGEALYNNAGTLDGFATQANGRAFVNSTAKVSDLSDISETTTLNDGNLAQYREGAWNFVTFQSAQNYESQLESGSLLDHGILSGLGDDDHTQYVLADGTRAITGDLSAVGVSATSGSVATTPTAANHIANKSYVDSQIPTPSYFQVISSGNITGVADEALTELGWASSGTYALSDPGGNLSLESGDSPDRSVINVSGDGVYQIDATVRISNTTERGGIVFRIYRDTGSGFTDIPELRASNYASRGTGSGEGITNGSCSINTILSLNANDRLQFRAQPKTAGATSIIQQEGTYVRIVKIA